MAKRVAHTVAAYPHGSPLPPRQRRGCLAPLPSLWHDIGSGMRMLQIQTAPTGLCETGTDRDALRRTPEVALTSTANGLDAVVIGSTCCSSVTKNRFLTTALPPGTTVQPTSTRGSIRRGLAASPVLLVAIASALRLSSLMPHCTLLIHLPYPDAFIPLLSIVQRSDARGFLAVCEFMFRAVRGIT